MSHVILDAGALIAVDRGDPLTISSLAAIAEESDGLKTHPMVVAQAWRDPGGRQAALARLLKTTDVMPIDESVGRRAGELRGEAGTDDPIDAVVALMANHGDRVLTSDPEEIAHLLEVRRIAARVVPV